MHTPPELDGAEIDISPATQAAGDHTIWRDVSTPVITVTIDGGQVTTARWPGH